MSAASPGQATLFDRAVEPQYASQCLGQSDLSVENFYECCSTAWLDRACCRIVTAQHRHPASTVALQIEGSSEYLRDQVQLLFQPTCTVRPDAGACQFHQSAQHGSSWSKWLLSSSALRSISASRGNKVTFLTALYVDALGGELPIRSGKRVFMQMLAGGAPRETVALAVFTSVEFRSNFIAQGFRQYLGRQALPKTTNFATTFQNGLHGIRRSSPFCWARPSSFNERT